MATRAARPCRTCGQATRDRSGYCPAHQAAIPQRWKGSRHERGYGNAWEKLRAYVLHRDQWLCQPCKKIGRLHPATQVDHILAKIHGGTDDPDNLQAIAAECHAAKSRTEQGGFAGAKKLPAMPKPPACRVVVVCGCPGSGKTSYVDQHKQPGDVVIDLDAIRCEMAGTGIHQAPNSRELLARAMRERNSRLFKLADADPGITAWFIAGAPTRMEREHWRAHLNAEIVVLETSPPEAKRRIAQDDTRAGKESSMCQWIDVWWQRYTPNCTDTVYRAG